MPETSNGVHNGQLGRSDEILRTVPSMEFILELQSLLEEGKTYSLDQLRKEMKLWNGTVDNMIKEIFDHGRTLFWKWFEGLPIAMCKRIVTIGRYFSMDPQSGLVKMNHRDEDFGYLFDMRVGMDSVAKGRVSVEMKKLISEFLAKWWQDDTKTTRPVDANLSKYLLLRNSSLTLPSHPIMSHRDIITRDALCVPYRGHHGKVKCDLLIEKIANALKCRNPNGCDNLVMSPSSCGSVCLVCLNMFCVKCIDHGLLDHCRDKHPLCNLVVLDYLPLLKPKYEVAVTFDQYSAITETPSALSDREVHNVTAFAISRIFSLRNRFVMRCTKKKKKALSFISPEEYYWHPVDCTSDSHQGYKESEREAADHLIDLYDKDCTADAKARLINQERNPKLKLDMEHCTEDRNDLSFREECSFKSLNLISLDTEYETAFYVKQHKKGAIQEYWLSEINKAKRMKETNDQLPPFSLSTPVDSVPSTPMVQEDRHLTNNEANIRWARKLLLELADKLGDPGISISPRQLYKLQELESVFGMGPVPHTHN